MNSPHILNTENDRKELCALFEQIASGNFILMLGAGASVTNKIYLSKQVIDYYEDGAGIKYNINDVTKFLDVLEPTPSFNRNIFDDKVSEYLKKLKVADHHKIIASISWKQILTTNYDLLLENAYDEIRNTSNHTSDLIPIKSLREYNTIYEANNEVRYVKLNGCLSDKSKYPFIFSTQDFKVFNILGNEVLSSKLNSGIQSIDLSNLDEGLYFLKTKNQARIAWFFVVSSFLFCTYMHIYM